MIKRLKNYFQNLRRDVDAIKYSQDQLWATQKLQSLFNEAHFIPQTGWSMTPQAILHILNIISLNKSKSIIEFGSGATTVYIAKLLQIEHSEAQFISIESSMEWKEKMEKQLADNGLEDYVQIIYAPLEKVDQKNAFKNQETWYATEILEEAISDISNFDLVIVDGPFGGSTPYARYSAFPFLQEKTTQETVWMLDDTGRAEEVEILNEWQTLSGLSRHSSKRYALLASPSTFDTAPYRFQ